MKILSVNILRGPNVWSVRRRELIDMVLDIGRLENYPTNTLDGFGDRLKKLMPSLYEHRCSLSRPGGFFERISQGTWMGHVVEHIALELQWLAGMHCGFGRTRSTGRKGIYHVVFAYMIPEAGVYAGKAAIRIAKALVDGAKYDIEKDIRHLDAIRCSKGLGPSTMSLVQEARKRNIPFRRINEGSLILFGYGKNQKTVCATMAGTTSSVGVEMATDKDLTRRLLEKAFVPIPKGRVVVSKRELPKAIQDIGYPMVIKPIDGNHGRGVKINIQSEEQMLEAFSQAKKISDKVIVEKFIQGFDYRFLVINYRLEAVARRTPAMVTGDGQSTIKELIDTTNLDPRRGIDHENVLTAIIVDAVTKRILKDKKLSLQSVLPKGEILFLKDAANLSAGGTATDVTDQVHPANVAMAERVARLLHLDICGIDVIAEDITRPVHEGNGGVIEVNAGPGFRMHLSPTHGAPRNVAEPVMRMLFPEQSEGRIPIVAVTGTNGKTTTTRLIAHMARNAGYHVGFTTTDGIFINGHQLFKGDCAGPSSAASILQDPAVDFAVLECARGGILREGLAFDQCDISIVTNVSEDHLGMDDIHTLEDMARVKEVVARSTQRNGFAILNADDDLVYAMRDEVYSHVALFSTSDANPRIMEHCQAGGMATYIEKGYFVLRNGDWKIRVARVKEVPVTLKGCATSMIKNVLPSLLAAAVQGFDVRVIRQSLMNFIPGPEHTPGRMNIFKYRHCEVMVDYAHNADGFKELHQFMQHIDSPDKIGIIGCPGDRRDEDLIEMGFLAGKTFDRLIIRFDKDGRGRSNTSIRDLIREGIENANPHAEIRVIADEVDAIDQAMKMSDHGGFIVVCSEDYQRCIDHLQDHRQRERKHRLSDYQMTG